MLVSRMKMGDFQLGCYYFSPVAVANTAVEAETYKCHLGAHNGTRRVKAAYLQSQQPPREPPVPEKRASCVVSSFVRKVIVV